MNEEIKEHLKNAMDWLASIEIHSEAEAIKKELLLSTIEYLENLTDCQHNALIKSISKQKILNKINDLKENRILGVFRGKRFRKYNRNFAKIIRRGERKWK